MEIKQASEFGDNIRKKISDIFVDGFIQWLQYFSKDSEKLSRAFAHMFILDSFYIAVIDGQPAGIAACTDGKTPPIRLQSKELRRHLGPIMGTIAGRILKKELENHPYPFPVESGWGSVEFVATDTRHRGKGVASAIIRHIVAETPYSTYILEVADTNTSAVKLYEKLGFREFMRAPQKHSKQSGIDYLVYMKYQKV
jgi:ribosomal protein S18 acetylase RimI-like enzyme